MQAPRPGRTSSDGPRPTTPPPGAPRPTRWWRAPTIIGVSCLLSFLTLGTAFMSTCAAYVAWNTPGTFAYHAHGSCLLDVVFLDEDGNEVRRTRVRGPTTTTPWTTSVDLGPGDRFKISVAASERACMVGPSCWVTYEGRELVPRTLMKRHPEGRFALCEGTVPR